MRRMSVAAAVLSVVALGSGVAFGQESRGSIAGLVTDSSGGALPGVTVTIVNTGTNATVFRRPRTMRKSVTHRFEHGDEVARHPAGRARDVLTDEESLYAFEEIDDLILLAIELTRALVPDMRADAAFEPAELAIRSRVRQTGRSDGAALGALGKFTPLEFHGRVIGSFNENQSDECPHNFARFHWLAYQ